MKMTANLLAAVAMLAMSTTVQAGLLIDSFENGSTGGWVGINGAAVSSTSSVSAAVTDGSSALEISGLSPSGWREAAKSGAGILADLVAYDTVDIDLYVPSIPTWAQAQLVVNNPVGGFQQLGFQNLVVGMNHLQGTYDPSSMGTPGMGSNVWAIVEIVINSDQAAAPLSLFYVDNLVLSTAVPEPTTFALLGLGVTMLAGGRRRNKC